MRPGEQEMGVLAHLTFASLFSAKKQACGPEGRALRGKSIGPSISDFELRISDFFSFFSIRIPQPTINPQSRWPARSKK
jgi:hypothetical protein